MTNSRLGSLSSSPMIKPFAVGAANKKKIPSGETVFRNGPPSRYKAPSEAFATDADKITQMKNSPPMGHAGQGKAPSFDKATYEYGSPEGKDSVPAVGFDHKTVGDLAGGKHNPNMNPVMKPVQASQVSDINVEDDGHNGGNDNPVGSQNKDLKYGENLEKKKQELNK